MSYHDQIKADKERQYIEKMNKKMYGVANQQEYQQL